MLTNHRFVHFSRLTKERQQRTHYRNSCFFFIWINEIWILLDNSKFLCHLQHPMT